MKKLLKEPLVHFLLIEAGLFLFYSQVNDTASGPNQRVVVSAGRIEQLARIFTKTWQRAPTRKELQGLIHEFTLEEAYYRRAVEMGLDRDDTIIRRRMRQKLEFLTDDTAALVEATDEELEKYLTENEDSFRDSATYTFQQAYFNPEKHGDDPEAYVAEQLMALRSGETEVADVSLLPTSFNAATRRVVDGAFGADFSRELDRLEVGKWQGPVRSGLGFHLIRIDSRTPGRLPELAEIRPVVEREWSNARRLAVRDEVNASLLAGYDVVIEWPESATDNDPATQASAP